MSLDEVVQPLILLGRSRSSTTDAQGDHVGFPVRRKRHDRADDDGDDGEDRSVTDEEPDQRAEQRDDHDESGNERDAAPFVRSNEFEHESAAHQNSTVGAVRAASSASKYSRRSKRSARANTTVGNCSSLLL